MAKVILLSGKGEAGKTSLANIIKKELEKANKKVLIIPFAGYLKFVAKQYFEWDGKKDENGRTLLQYLGTDIVRRKNPNFWVETVGNFINLFSEEFDFFIIDDCRFLEEIRYFKDINIIDNFSIRVKRLNYENSLTKDQRNHASETALDNYSFDLYINSETGLDNLKTAFRQTLLKDVKIREWMNL